MSYTRINWENEPSLDTPINATNLNNMDATIYTHDQAISTLQTAVAGKQDALTFDDSPTASSANPVKSGGVYSALTGKTGNAYTNIKIGNTTISATTTGDTFEFVQGTNVILTPDLANKKLTIAATGGGGGGDAIWGAIQGTLSDQTDLQNALNAKADAGTWLTETAALGATSVTFTDNAIESTSMLDLYANGTPTGFVSVTVTTGSAVFTVPALTASTDFKLWVRN